MATSQPSLPAHWAIYLDIPITRRKAFHILVNPDGEHVRHARRISDLVRWLDAKDVREYVFHLPGEEQPALLCTRL